LHEKAAELARRLSYSSSEDRWDAFGPIYFKAMYSRSRRKRRKLDSRFSETLPRRQIFTVPPLEPNFYRIIVSLNNGGTS
jgi:hypothetical protein